MAVTGKMIVTRFCGKLLPNWGKHTREERGEDQVQLLHSLESSLSGVGRLQAEQDDTQLVQASQHGDQDAFALLVQRYQRPVFNLALGVLQDYDDASESTQEAFLAAWQGLPDFRDEARCFPTWLYRITYQCCLRQLERREREQVRHSAMQVKQVLARGDNEKKQTVETNGRRELRAKVREQLEHLPTRYRAVLILRHLQHMTYEEMAEVLSIPVGTVKTHLFRARHLLRERLLSQHLVGVEPRERS
jgi:RNA polymerase sigma-70 factor (ECF subfamily)